MTTRQKVCETDEEQCVPVEPDSEYTLCTVCLAVLTESERAEYLTEDAKRQLQEELEQEQQEWDDFEREHGPGMI
jgi:hypothetical protein